MKSTDPTTARWDWNWRFDNLKNVLRDIFLFNNTYRSVFCYICQNSSMKKGSISTEKYILDRVAPLFNRKGYVGTSLTDITDATQLTKGAIYCNFKNKEDLAVKAFQHNIELVLGPLGNCIREAQDAPGKLHAITCFYRSYFETVAARGGCPVLNVGIDAKYINPELYTAARQVADQLMGNLERILEKGIAFNQLKPEINVKAVASNLYAMIEGGIYLASLNDQPQHLEHVLDLADDLIDRLCRKE